ASPVHIMKKFVALQMRYGISLLVIAHTDSRSTREALQALANRDIYAKLKPRPLVKPEHTPSQNRYQSNNNDCRGGWESSRNHQQSQTEGGNSPSESSENSEHTPHLTKIDDDISIDFTDSNIPRAERRRALRAYRKLQALKQ
ncbi:MAG: hypothetical protein K2J74_04010, partial [Muribaculaceae bacterium]|nr:hypothetical protein [Muribaculaceae bacterium]